MKPNQRAEIVEMVNSGTKSAAEAARLFDFHRSTTTRDYRTQSDPVLINDIEIEVSLGTSPFPLIDHFTEAVRMEIIVGIKIEHKITTSDCNTTRIAG